jgi:hypothetical protein
LARTAIGFRQLYRPGAAFITGCEGDALGWSFFNVLWPFSQFLPRVGIPSSNISMGYYKCWFNPVNEESAIGLEGAGSLVFNFIIGS